MCIRDSEWEEQDAYQIVRTGPKPEAIQVYSHSHTRIPGKEGLLMDTGAWDNLSGGDSIERQENEAKQNGYHTKWEQLPNIRKVGGVGHGHQQCSMRCTMPMCLPSGVVMKYTTPVMDRQQGIPSPCPTLGGLKMMASMNVYFGTACGLMALVPKGKDEEIVWPKGTTFINCEPAVWTLADDN